MVPKLKGQLAEVEHLMEEEIEVLVVGLMEFYLLKENLR